VKCHFLIIDSRSVPSSSRILSDAVGMTITIVQTVLYPTAEAILARYTTRLFLRQTIWDAFIIHPVYRRKYQRYTNYLLTFLIHATLRNVYK